MGDEDEGDAEGLLQRLQFLLHLFAKLQIERAQRLVEKQNLGLVDERAGERHALALAAGKLSGPARAVARKLHHGERILGALRRSSRPTPLTIRP